MYWFGNCHGPPENPEKTIGIFLRLKFLDSIVLGEVNRKKIQKIKKNKKLKEKLTKGILPRNVFENKQPVV